MNLSPNLKLFNDKIRFLNQTQSKQLILTSQEANGLHSEIFDLLNQLNILSQAVQVATGDENGVISVEMDGGKFQ
jgi:hypothetical protein